ncbi:MAG: RluA family pseudouridine synthase [Candidatus Electryoneaceae bacterium]|nr:RluA family pseudouridine synthase [Candidatus Electryoneaceae bacterium]
MNAEQDPQIEKPPRKILRRVIIKIPLAKTPERLDRFLFHQVAELTRSKAQTMIQSGDVTVDGQRIKPSHKVRPGELIELTVLSRPPLDIEPEDIPLDVIWEDDWLAIINKPAGLVCHPAVGNPSGTLVNALLGRYQQLAQSDDPQRPGLVHRLDKATSGLLVVCKREEALSKMGKLFRERTIEREYRAIAWWVMPSRRGVVDQPIGRDSRNRIKMTVRQDGKHARTHWEQLEQFDFLCYLKLKLETGRTHQIRVHMTHQGHSIFGDPDYAGRNRQMGRLTSAQRAETAEYFSAIHRQMLHARTLGFVHPMTEEKLMFESPLPEDFAGLLKQLREIKAARQR